MRFKYRLLLAAGCIGLLALSFPAFSKPRGVEKPRTQSHRAVAHKPAAANRLVSMPIAETPKRPIFGWPALVREARKYLGTNPTARKNLWCATFMNLVLAKVGYAGTNSDAAKSFAEYGHRVSEPEVGAIAVLTRGKNGGHVGVVSGIDKYGNPIIISGNHGRRVGEAIYPRSRVIAYVVPTAGRPAATQVADRGKPVQASFRSGLESPIAELLAAIEAERSRAELPRPQVAQARAPEPRRVAHQPPVERHRAVQQLPDQPRSFQRAGTLPLDPALARLFGTQDRAQARGQVRGQTAPRPQPQAPQRQRQVQQHQPDRVAHADRGMMGAFSLR